MTAQPLFGLLPGWNVHGNDAPKLARVILLKKMRQLVDDQVIDYHSRGLDDAPVER
jgi:hypothetical protein